MESDLNTLTEETIRVGQRGFPRRILRERMELACAWIADIAQLKDENDPTPIKHKQKSWQGALRGEYHAATRAWSFYCPVWHTGQAIKALVLAHTLTGEKKWLDAARAGAAFIVNNQVHDRADEDDGLILAYEDYPDKVNTSAILECLDGLIVLDEACGEHRYTAAVAAAAGWVARKAWIAGEGLFRDLYDPVTKAFVENAYGFRGRPLLDDAIFLKAARICADQRFKAIFFETADRLLRDEHPAGNWICYAPCNATRGAIHPRHAYWWGYPMLAAHLESGNSRYGGCFERACRWYANAQRQDGGLFRGTYADFRTDSFGHAASGIPCAMIMWAAYGAWTGADRFAGNLARGLEFCFAMQFINPSDPNLKGAVLEKVLPPDGTDNLPYHIRDLGSIFFVQAVVNK